MSSCHDRDAYVRAATAAGTAPGARAPPSSSRFAGTGSASVARTPMHTGGTAVPRRACSSRPPVCAGVGTGTKALRPRVSTSPRVPSARPMQPTVTSTSTSRLLAHAGTCTAAPAAACEFEALGGRRAVGAGMRGRRREATAWVESLLAAAFNFGRGAARHAVNARARVQSAAGWSHLGAAAAVGHIDVASMYVDASRSTARATQQLQLVASDRTNRLVLHDHTYERSRRAPNNPRAN